MNNEKQILETLEKLDKRVAYIEEELNIVEVQDDLDIPAPIEDGNFSSEIVEHKDEFNSIPTQNLTFTQIISFLGITGIVIGILSLFFYAIANNWISKGGQILVGVLVGLILYLFGISFYKKKEEWANFMIGGGFFVEFLSISIGVLSYNVLSEVIGFFLLLAFVIISILLCIKFKSKIIAYYSLVGGFLVPILSGLSGSQAFILSYLLVLSVGLLIISTKFNWIDLRFFSFFFESIYLISQINPISIQNSQITIPIIFLILNFLLFNISSIIFSIKKNIQINPMDILILNANSILFISLLYSILYKFFSLMEFGFVVLPIAFLYLFEIYFIKSINSKTESEALNYSILSSAIISLNLAFFIILNNLNIDFFIIPFIIEWFLFAFISKKSTNKNYFNIVSNLFLFLVVLWYLAFIRFDRGELLGTIYLFVIAAIPITFLSLNLKNINREFNGGGFLISVFVFIFSLYKYLLFFIPELLGQIFLSVMWLTYTLVVLKLVSYKKEAKTLMMFLLGITLLKIAFVDLTYLSGVYKILGFIVFGIILLIGAYFIKNEVKN